MGEPMSSSMDFTNQVFVHIETIPAAHTFKSGIEPPSIRLIVRYMSNPSNFSWSLGPLNSTISKSAVL